MAMDSLALTGRAGGDVGSYVVGDSIPDEMVSNQFERLISAPVATTRTVVIDLQKLIPNSLLRQNKNTSKIPYETILGVVLQPLLRCQSQ